ncbi:type II secretion system protein [Aeromicrobium alkaliterrae]|uniref:Type II secretion system protein GspF domain-containing protein n=1 Tax=Aeromicrobium alkaliterrae TaxID=302168 RepID=A0ABP4W4R1_9ACTN
MSLLPLTTWAAVAAGCAVLLRWPDPDWAAAHRLDLAGPARWPRLLLILVAVPAVAAVLPSVGGVAPVLVLVTGAAVAAFVGREVRRATRRDAARAALQEVTALVDLLAAELRAGTLPEQALATAAVDHELVAPAARVARLGGDVAAALRLLVDRPGCQGMAAVAGAWRLSETCGAPLADVLDQVGRGLRFESELADEIRSTVEPARATGRLLAVLPLLGLLLGAGLGADPVEVLTTTLPGAACLVLGTVLACTGVRWIETTADRAERG